MNERIILLKQGHFKSIDSLNKIHQDIIKHTLIISFLKIHTCLLQVIEQANNQFITLKIHMLLTKDLKDLYIEVNFI
jgi:hypothetical protein